MTHRRLHNTDHQHGGDNEIATATPAANAIPKGDGNGKLASGWGGNANTLASLDSNAKVPNAQLHASATPSVDTIPIAGAIQPQIHPDWIQDATTTGKGKVELAENKESAANLAVQANDDRLSDARTPTAHAASHQDGGSDEVGTATPAANAIPKADASSKLDTWISDASETVKGKIEIATQAEVDAKTDATRAVTPLTLSNFIIERLSPTTVSATGAITTTSLVDTLIPSMTITPGAGSYLVFFGMTASHNKSGQTVFGSIYANGTQYAPSERNIGGQSNNLGNLGSIAQVSVGDGQAIEARWRVSSNSGGGQGSSPGSRSLMILQVA